MQQVHASPAIIRRTGFFGWTASKLISGEYIVSTFLAFLIGQNHAQAVPATLLVVAFGRVRYDDVSFDLCCLNFAKNILYRALLFYNMAIPSG